MESTLFKSCWLMSHVIFKAAPWDDINLCFFCNEVVYPPDHDFNFFRLFRFKKIFFINISMNPLKNQTNLLHIYTLAKWRLYVPTALGHMSMQSAQRWADNQCCRCIPSCPDYKTPISSDCFDLSVQDVGICGVMLCNVLYIAYLFCSHGNIRPENITISLFGALKLLFYTFFYFFVFLVKISRLNSFI